jgi:adenosylhomocysteine nucleosidase
MTSGVRSIGILIAMKEELQSLLRIESFDWTGPGNFFTGRHGPIRLQVALSGAGLERAQQTSRLLATRGNPDLLLSVGLSGALKPDLRIGDLILGTQAQMQGALPRSASTDLLGRAKRICGCKIGGLLSVPTVLSEAREKAAAAACFHEALALDMESYALAKTADEHNLPWLGLRAISDSLTESLPMSFNDSIGADGQVSRLRIIVKLVRRPQSISPLLRFSHQVQRAQWSLLKGLDELLGALSW